MSSKAKLLCQKFSVKSQYLFISTVQMEKRMQSPALETTACQSTEAEVAVGTDFLSPSAITE